MTVKEASVKFKLEQKEIRKRKEDGMILGVMKDPDNGSIIIPDDTKIIPSKSEIRAFLLQILKYKNNTAYIVAKNLCPDKQSEIILFDYLLRRGFIGEYSDDSDFKQLLCSVQLTEAGISYVLGQSLFDKLNLHNFLPVSINIGCVVV